MLGLQLGISSTVTQLARLARDLWKKINDVWNREERKWKDIV